MAFWTDVCIIQNCQDIVGTKYYFIGGFAEIHIVSFAPCTDLLYIVNLWTDVSMIQSW